jgi:hypothetical protein
MARRSLKPQLNQIRTWVRQGRTDAWIAHQLEVSVKDVDAFKREHELVPSDDIEAPAADEPYGPPIEEEPDLRAEDDALVAAALDAEPEETDDAEDGDESGDGDGSEGGRLPEAEGDTPDDAENLEVPDHPPAPEGDSGDE